MDPAESFRQRWRARTRPAMISVHRGLWSAGPENSVKAIAAAQGFDIIEIDTQLARDGVPVVVHDANLARTAGKDMVIGEHDHSALTSQCLRMGAGGPNAEMTQERVPTLVEALGAASAESYFDIDVKFPNEVEAVAKFLALENLQSGGSLKVDTKTSADIDALLALQETYGGMVMAKIVLPEVGLDHVRELVGTGVAAIEVWFDDLDQLEAACVIAGNDTAISTFTLDPVHCCGLADARAVVDPDAVWGKLLEAGVTIIMTDLAASLDGYLSKSS